MELRLLTRIYRRAIVQTVRRSYERDSCHLWRDLDDDSNSVPHVDRVVGGSVLLRYGYLCADSRFCAERGYEAVSAHYYINRNGGYSSHELHSNTLLQFT